MSTEKKIELFDPKRKLLNPEKLSELSGLNLSDEQAEEIILALRKYAQILYEFTIQQEQSTNGKANQTSNDPYKVGRGILRMKGSKLPFFLEERR